MTEPCADRGEMTVGIVGLGFLGRGIAACLLGHGLRVVGFARRQETQEEALDYIATGIDELIERAGFPPSLAGEYRDRYQTANAYDALAPCQFVIESVAEDLQIKQSVFEQIEAVVDDSAVLGSNTSAIPISLLQETMKNPRRLLGTHWSEPAHATRFLELIRGEQTSEEAMEAAVRLGRRVGKEPAIVRRDVPGFIVNRLAYAMYREALHLIESGVADAETIDRSFRNSCGMWASLCGPLRWIDITGGPALYAQAMTPVVDTLSKLGEVPPTLRTLAEADARGTINGRGFYNYSPEEARAWQRKLHEQAWIAREMINRNYPLDENENES